MTHKGFVLNIATVQVSLLLQPVLRPLHGHHNGEGGPMETELEKVAITSHRKPYHIKPYCPSVAC